MMQVASQQRAQGTRPKGSQEFTLLPTSMGENISVVSSANAIGTAIPYFICLNSLLLYLNLHVFRRKNLAGHIISTVQVIWPKACLSENSSFLALMIKD
jgi:hypothetical protein